jgi:transposase
MDTTIRPNIAGTDRRPYERRGLRFKRELVALTLVPGASVARLAREHGVNANQVFTWRKLYREGRLGTANSSAVRMLPVEVAPATMAGGTQLGEAEAQKKACSGRLRIECARAHLIIEGSPDAQVLRVVLEHLLR